MDVLRPRTKRVPRALVWLAVLVAAGVAVAWSLRAMSSAPKGTLVDRATLVTDVVRRETLLRSVSAAGTLVPERVRVVAASEDGVVDRVLVRPGSSVSVGQTIAQISNPALIEKVVDAQAQVDVARANIASARQQAAAAQLTQRAAIADAEAQAQVDVLRAHSTAKLIGQGLVPEVDYRKAQIDATKSRNDVAIGRAQLSVAAADASAKLAALQAQLAEAQAQLVAARAQVGALTVRAGAPGVVQSVAVDPGARVSQGAELARIADQRDLKAQLQVPEAALRDVSPGMPATIDTGAGTLPGHVERIAPAAQNGTVAVDVGFDRPLPSSIRPDGNVTGAIVLARLPHALTLARPAGANDGASLDLFKVVDGGTRAVRVRVRLGSGSTERVQLVSGLRAGDTAIVSDTSAYADSPELRLR